MNRRAGFPDEHYIHTIVGNSQFARKATGLQKFTGIGTYRMANLHHIDPSLSKWFTELDFELLRKSDKLFVRKVRTSDGTGLVNRIDEELLGLSK
jgi:hypothetical protein